MSDPDATAARGSATGNAPPVIDVHAHWYPEECVAEVVQHCPELQLRQAPDGPGVLLWRGSVAHLIPPAAGDVTDRLRLMDQLGIQVQILSFGAVDVAWAGVSAPAVARRVNDQLAAVCRSQPARFRFLAALALGDRRQMLAELERALGLGAVGVGLTTTVGGLPLDAPEYRDFWREASARGLPVVVHPCYPPTGPAADPGTFLLAGFPGETTLAAARLVLGGVLEECPGVRVVWSHVGGALPMLVARLDAAYRRYPNCPQPASAYLRRCYFDTVCVHGPALDCARESFGAGTLLFGTDEPHRLEPPRMILETLRGRPWPADEIVAALGGTAARLFAAG
jgi:aminocarboxymuconate-semialdehyde decarboxylase